MYEYRQGESEPHRSGKYAVCLTTRCDPTLFRFRLTLVPSSAPANASFSYPCESIHLASIPVVTVEHCEGPP